MGSVAPAQEIQGLFVDFIQFIPLHLVEEGLFETLEEKPGGEKVRKAPFQSFVDMDEFSQFRTRISSPGLEAGAGAPGPRRVGNGGAAGRI